MSAICSYNFLCYLLVSWQCSTSANASDLYEYSLGVCLNFSWDINYPAWHLLWFSSVPPGKRLDSTVGASHMSDNRQMSVAMQRLVYFISMVTNSTLLRNNTITILLAGFSVGWSIRNSLLLCNGWRNYEVQSGLYLGHHSFIHDELIFIQNIVWNVDCASVKMGFTFLISDNMNTWPQHNLVI
jgi:hypothetical protein